MKLPTAAVVFVFGIIAKSDGFHVPTTNRAAPGKGVVSRLEMGGFLDGKYGKSDIMKEEDDAMWIDENDTGPSWNPFAAKPAAKAAPKQAAPPPPVAKKPTGGGFPWQKKKAPPPPEPEPEPEPPKSGAFKFPWQK
uniref:Uncharacterized protein n=1 Tax=Trieres chinensis TaxID=1514140 RepID=A0A7S1ZI50_TRICV|eukprot:CAMPEP_0183290788 /NCGR_PEP_ID=MMETSP0160_2-20130417/382_1 /TAXON_ID=2839 ORGANISM="Odontella Sinensis, Strain Grunow 1884" /NCGR_SAMPLE_ID=MMETSP0160_2 /ASSEMBLY_ACC=CAM_ASM_000250 /LENGTH=135 /DNA_ID=CAMNT_0025451453 /DNA_START=71 /DNA_END=478 /DNA_ORIENTATION=+